MPGALARWRPGAPGDSPILFDFLRANTVSRLKYAQLHVRPRDYMPPWSRASRGLTLESPMTLVGTASARSPI